MSESPFFRGKCEMIFARYSGKGASRSLFKINLRTKSEKMKKNYWQRHKLCCIIVSPLRRGFFVAPFSRERKLSLRLREVKSLWDMTVSQIFQEVPKVRVKITMVCSECKQRNYNTKKNKKNDPDRLEMNKYCRFCRKHTLHKESK